MGLFSRSQKIETVLLVDISDARVMCATLRLDKEKPAVLATAQKPIMQQSVFSGERYLHEMQRALTGSLAALAPNHGAPPNRVIVTLSSLLCLSQVRSVSIPHAHRQTLDHAFFEHYTEEEASRFTQAHPHGVLLDRKIMRVDMNGYSTTHFAGKKADTVRLDLYVSLVDKNVHAAVREVIAAATHQTNIELHSYSFATWRALDYWLGLKEYLLIDMGAEITTLTAVIAEKLHASVSLPFGKNEFLRGLVKDLGTTPTVAASLVRTFFEGRLSGAAKERMQPTLSRLAQRWATLSAHGVQKLSLERTPKALLILADSDLGTFLEHELVTGTPTRVMPLRSSLLASYCTHEGRTTQENFFLLSVLFSATLKKHHLV